MEILRVMGAFGVRGAMRAISFSSNLSRYRKVYDKNGNEFSFRVVKFSGKNRVVIVMDGAVDRNWAESFKNEIFYVKKSDLPPIEKNEIYVCDLIGKEVLVLDSDLRCRIVDVKNFGAGDLIEISYEGATFLTPFTSENFPDSEDQILMTLQAFNGFKN